MNNQNPTIILKVKGRILKEQTRARVIQKLKKGSLSPSTYAHNPDGIWRRLSDTPGYRKICMRIKGNENIPNESNHGVESSTGIESGRLSVEGANLIESKETKKEKNNLLDMGEFNDEKKSLIQSTDCSTLQVTNSAASVAQSFQTIQNTRQIGKYKKMAMAILLLAVIFGCMYATLIPKSFQNEVDNYEQRMLRSKFYDKALTSKDKKVLFDQFINKN